jgi:hypothetical protein
MAKSAVVGLPIGRDALIATHWKYLLRNFRMLAQQFPLRQTVSV